LPSPLIPLIYTLLASSALRDWLKLFLMGGLLEAARRVLGQSWTLDGFFSGLYLHVRIEREDEAYDWLLAYFMSIPAFRRTRNLCVSTRSRGKTGSNYIEGCHCSECSRNKPKKEDDLGKRLHYLPAYECDYSFFFAGTWVTVMRTRENGGAAVPMGVTLTSMDALQLRILSISPTRGRTVLERLLSRAKAEFDKDEEERISVWVGDQYGGWTRAASKLRRPWSSIVLDPGVKDTLLADARDFLSTQAWYVQRGIPYRRGYLLHGVPGSGKTSLIHALSGELGLDIYVISLSKRTMDDQALNDIVTQLPPQCIALMEDIDCAFKKGIAARVSDDTTDPAQEGKAGPAAPAGLPRIGEDLGAAAVGNITLSGLLNAIDGVAAHEGRLLFATTNVREALDPALIRPGRMDVVLEFKNASQSQAEALFRCFYPVEEPGEEPEAGKSKHFAGPPPAAALPLTPPRTPTDPAGTPTLTVEPLPSTAVADIFTRAARDALAARFAAAIPEREFSMAALQGYLMLHKIDPVKCVDGVEAWIVEERERKVKKK
ncbi:P-loop containing nucleoside triphosphate hydrolase protein, partial [Calocera viscosa TUFC12733]